MNPEKLQALSRTPRNLSNAEKSAIRSKPFFFFFEGVKKWEEGMANGPLVHEAVVQANECLYSPEDVSWAPAVTIYTTDPRYALNGPWLLALARQIRELKTNGIADKECQMLAALLFAEDSSIHQKVPKCLTAGIDVEIHTEHLDPTSIPGGYLQANTLFLSLLIDGSVSKLPPAMYC